MEKATLKEFVTSDNHDLPDGQIVEVSLDEYVRTYHKEIQEGSKNVPDIYYKGNKITRVDVNPNYPENPDMYRLWITTTRFVTADPFTKIAVMINLKLTYAEELVDTRGRIIDTLQEKSKTVFELNKRTRAGFDLPYYVSMDDVIDVVENITDFRLLLDEVVHAVVNLNNTLYEVVDDTSMEEIVPIVLTTDGDYAITVLWNNIMLWSTEDVTEPGGSIERFIRAEFFKWLQRFQDIGPKIKTHLEDK